ncbi:hypothetical protein EDB85DRAFT_2299207 [Lactarius pseudohatsudake]|nr:hypothetical protein EDB85DRAFT_2299207 [Lactarius pseudohatsudake]
MGCCNSKPQADERGATSNGQGPEVPTPPPQQQSAPKPAGKSPQVPSNEQPTVNKGPTLQEKVALEVTAVSRHSSQQSVAEPARGSPQFGGASSYERPTTDLDDKGPTSPEQVVPPAVSRLPSQKNGTKGPTLQEKVVPSVAQAVSRHPSQQSVAKPARKSPQVGGASPYERLTTNVDDKGPTMQERVVPPVARAISRLPSQQNGPKPARESSRVGGTSSYEQPTTNLDDRGPTSQERVVLPVARAVSRLPSQQNGTRPPRELPNQVGGPSSYERPTTNLDDRGLISQDQVVPPVARAISRHLSQQSGTKPARKSPQVGGASLYERSMTNVGDKGPTSQEWAVPSVARAVSRLPSQQSGTRPAHQSPDQVGGTSSYGQPTTNLDDRGPASREQAGPPVARTVSRLHSQQSGTNQAHESPQVGRAPSYKQPTRSAWATAKSPLSTVGSVPQKVDEDWPTLMLQGPGAKSPVAQSGTGPGSPMSATMADLRISLTMVRALKGIFQTFSCPSAAQFDSAASALRRRQIPYSRCREERFRKIVTHQSHL